MSKLAAIFSTLFLGVALPAHGEDERPADAVRAIVNRETQFFEYARDHGTRAAFLEFLSDDSVMFDPEPVKAKEMWSNRAESDASLIWQPTFAAVARGADLGYDTGPWEWRKTKDQSEPDAYGHFVSIWKKQADRSWKVALDYGIDHRALQQPPTAAEMSSADDGWNETVEIEKARKSAQQAQTAFIKAADNDAVAAIASFADPTVRVYRDDVFPAVGKDAAAVMLTARGGKVLMKPLGGALSRTGDLGYDYGRYSLTRGSTKERGHYLQIWRTNATGQWKLVLDLERKLPPEKRKVQAEARDASPTSEQ